MTVSLLLKIIKARVSELFNTESQKIKAISARKLTMLNSRAWKVSY
jgi:hypothetical protein